LVVLLNPIAMKFDIQHQESYSRLELILRSFFGFLYIVIPHSFILMFVGLWGAILTFISFWAILFTGRYPQSFFEFQVHLIRWNARVNARILNLADGYPAFGLKAEDEKIEVQIPYPENLSRGLLIVKVLFGAFYVGIPHGFMLFFRFIWSSILLVLSWLSVLFTGNFPKGWHEFIVGTLRWSTRVNIYLYFMSDDYPPFSGRPDPDDDSSVSEPAQAPPIAPSPAPEEHAHLSSPDPQAEIPPSPEPPPTSDSGGDEQADSDQGSDHSGNGSDDNSETTDQREEDNKE
jgi:Domain of unknown function (DUF4389)